METTPTPAGESLLAKIEKPGDLKALSAEQLVILAEELRQFIIAIVAKTGGHLAPSLGVIELTLAMMKVYDFEEDKLVWDVGHQAYPWKILTGRRDRFHSIRQKDGLSGFPRRVESPLYDHFGTAHASTSISAAFGMAVARDLLGKKNKVIAVIGDGALTGGLAYEGLNNAGGSERDILVILNDNEMSIARNVGAMHKYLTNFTSTPFFHRQRERVKHTLEKLPMVGSHLTEVARRMEEAAKGFLTPGVFFETLGFHYFGPIDGHDLPELLRVLGNMHEMPGPKLLHVLTKKGKGYTIAENKPDIWHGVGPFDADTGELLKKATAQPLYQNAFGEIMSELAKLEPKLVGITAAMPSGTGISIFCKAFPERTFDAGIAEQHAVEFAAGLSTQGIRPVAAIYSTFLQRAYDQIIHDVGLQSLPVIFCMDRAGLAGEDGQTHHGLYDIVYFRQLPGFVVAAPKDGNELRDLLWTAIAHTEGPFAIRYPKDQAIAFTAGQPPALIPIGTWEILEKGTGDTIFLAYGAMVQHAREAAAKLMAAGAAPITVVNARFCKPLDDAMLGQLLPKARLVATFEEGQLLGGFGSAILEWAAAHLDGGPKIMALGVPDVYVEHATRKQQFAELKLDADGLAATLSPFLQLRSAAAS